MGDEEFDHGGLATTDGPMQRRPPAWHRQSRRREALRTQSVLPALRNAGAYGRFDRVRKRDSSPYSAPTSASYNRPLLRCRESEMKIDSKVQKRPQGTDRA